MSREIKFRAWHPDYGKDGAGYMFNWKRLRANYNLYAFTNDPGNIMKLMQYTGLKDKNSVAIYEGDIVRICHYEPFDDEDPDDKAEYSVHEVKWGELAWVVSPTYSEEYNDLGMVGEGWEDGHLWMEVIGNIYENPDLLGNSL